MKKVLLISIAIFISIPVIIWALAGGQGKSEGNSCMSRCAEANAEFYNSSDDLTQFCQTECNVGTGQGACLTSKDGCCVLFTDDPDCCSSNEDCSGGEFCELPAGQCDESDIIGTCVLVPEVCFHLYDPVCDCDNVTHSNDCFRAAAQAQLNHDGACESSRG